MPNTRVPAIQQRLRADAESICFKCFHRKVCRAIDNQPCIECNQFTDANGVTVQQWIPVAERLPEESGEYLAITANGVYCCLGYSTKHKAFNASDYIDNVAEIACTHWMPLPQPPKGE